MLPSAGSSVKCSGLWQEAVEPDASLPASIPSCSGRFSASCRAQPLCAAKEPAFRGLGGEARACPDVQPHRVEDVVKPRAQSPQEMGDKLGGKREFLLSLMEKTQTNHSSAGEKRKISHFPRRASVREGGSAVYLKPFPI